MILSLCLGSGINVLLSAFLNYRSAPALVISSTVEIEARARFAELHGYRGSFKADPFSTPFDNRRSGR
jgi:hypothetical protein